MPDNDRADFRVPDITVVWANGQDTTAGESAPAMPSVSAAWMCTTMKRLPHYIRCQLLLIATKVGCTVCTHHLVLEVRRRLQPQQQGSVSAPPRLETGAGRSASIPRHHRWLPAPRHPALLART